MKKMDYMAPEMEIVKMKYCKFLCASENDNEPPYGGGGQPGVNDPD